VRGKLEDADDMTVLVTGGLGYIGSHTCVSLLQSGHDVVILDNLSNSVPLVAQRIEAIAGRKPVFVQGDMLDRGLLDRLFAEHRIGSVIHFAGYKAVGESVAEPLKYYRNNLTGTLCLLESMAKAGVKTLVFSSSATVYGEPASLPIREDFPRSATNPYGRSKLIQEEIFNDLAASDPEWKIVNLRYFNPVGAHESGLIGEDPRDIPNNLMPYLLQVAIGRLPELRVFGGDYPTPDGTGVRDYIHVVDLAEGHLAALKYLETARGCVAVNLGTGRGVSVLELCEAFERATNHKVPRRIVDRRPGDVAACWSDPSLARTLFGWQAERELQSMCRDAWNWQIKNPEGYTD
jgi:UDP-glucose 4-epimerase